MSELGSPPSSVSSRLVFWGWLAALLVPAVGLVIGIVLVARQERGDGPWILGISVGWIALVWTFLLMQQAR